MFNQPTPLILRRSLYVNGVLCKDRVMFTADDHDATDSRANCRSSHVMADLGLLFHRGVPTHPPRRLAGYSPPSADAESRIVGVVVA
jgi:hypothetical protein